MPWSPLAPVRRRLAWRLVSVFVAVVLLPLAASDWLATTALDDLAQRQAHDRAAAETQAAAQAVFDRLLLARAWLDGLARSGSPRRRQAAWTPVDFEAFSRVECRGAPGATAAASEAARAVHVELLGPVGGGAPAVRMQAALDGGADCLGQLNPAYLSAALGNFSDDAVWVVRDSGGAVLARWAGAEARPASAGAEAFTAHLFMGAEFGAPAWTVERSAVREAPTWHGHPLWSWLALAGTATILGIGLLAQWHTRRTLAPLVPLTEAARALARGGPVAPLAAGGAAGADELGELTRAFDTMNAELSHRISSLRALAEIDGAILQGRSFSDVAGVVVERVCAGLPGTAAVVAWRLPGRRIAVLARPASGASSLSESVLGPEQDRAFDALADGPWDPPRRTAPDALAGALAPWLVRRDGQARDVFVVRDGVRNRAVLVLPRPGAGATAAPTGREERRDERRELRDRLAVALFARAREEKLDYRARHDALTGLANAYGVLLQVQQLLAQGRPLVALLFDLDRFKDVNDRHGHPAGDGLLREIAARITRLAPPRALVGRHAGDEFVLVLEEDDTGHAQALAGRVLEDIARPAVVDGIELFPGASVGIAAAPRDGADWSELLRCADIALYESKRLGRHCCTVFSAELGQRTRERNDLIAELRKAIARGELAVVYQPRVHRVTAEPAGVEALVRWNHPQRGELSPGVFIGLAEDAGLIDELGDYVLETVTAQAARWKEQGLRFGRISVNVSQRQFASGRLVPGVRALLERRGIDGRALEIEVTESLLSTDLPGVRSQLLALRELGLSVALDDFGTGYSSMALLRQLPIDILKIDRAFVEDLCTDPTAQAVACSIVALARALSLGVVAEGVETPEQASALTDMGCDELQGFHYAPPLGAAAVESYLARRGSVAVPAGIVA